MPIQQQLIPPFHQHLQEATDEEVLRMKPYALAAQWQADPEEVLRLFLYATKVGLLNLQWELMCPNCRVPKAEYSTLLTLSKRFHCDLCGVDLEADLDRYVELRFSVHPAVRQAQDAIYCIGGPMNTPHILLQQYLAPGEAREVKVSLEPEALRVRALRYNQTAILTPTMQPAGPLEIVYTEEGWTPLDLLYCPGTRTLRLQNQSSRVLVAVLERLQWDKYAVTAAQVTTMQEFRELFSSEVLAPGQEISIQNLSILFTDLKGSTALYEVIGDAPAYGRVHRHFSVLIHCIQKNQGALVKTIGDAVMAAFVRPEAAVQAALDILLEMEVFNRTQHIDPPLIIKIGVHHGPAIAINANNRLDYFGRTVNIAARVQQESIGGDIVLTADLLQQPAVQQVLQPYPKPVSFLASLKGIEGVYTLYRLMMNPEDPPHPAPLLEAKNMVQ
jgi:class 3 adenylate cyclase